MAPGRGAWGAAWGAAAAAAGADVAAAVEAAAGAAAVAVLAKPVELASCQARGNTKSPSIKSLQKAETF